MNSRVYGLIKIASKIGSDYYPEIMGNTFICNAPFLFTGVWAIVKGFLDERTRAKILIKGGGYQKDLLQLVDKENLPDFLGGEADGKLFPQELGPWNDYEIVKPYGIRRKSDGVYFNWEKQLEGAP